VPSCVIDRVFESHAFANKARIRPWKPAEACAEPKREPVINVEDEMVACKADEQLAFGNREAAGKDPRTPAESAIPGSAA
jgi:hypothetical protein